LFFFFLFSLYALLSKKHAKVTELIKQAESNSQENGEGAQNSDHVSITSVNERDAPSQLMKALNCNVILKQVNLEIKYRQFVKTFTSQQLFTQNASI